MRKIYFKIFTLLIRRYILAWIFNLVLDVIANIVAYITNPIVCLFANEVGQLPHCFRWWQTYDNPLDIRWMVTDGIVPKIFRYDFDKHYVYVKENHKTGGNGYVTLLDDNFTIKEKIQRYFCRLAWMYRNTAYGFSYEVNGRYVCGGLMSILVDDNEDGNRVWISVDNGKSIFTRTWCVYIKKNWCKHFYIKVFLGWKCQGMYTGDNQRCMFACNINPFRKRRD